MIYSIDIDMTQFKRLLNKESNSFTYTQYFATRIGDIVRLMEHNEKVGDVPEVGYVGKVGITYRSLCFYVSSLTTLIDSKKTYVIEVTGHIVPDPDRRLQ